MFLAHRLPDGGALYGWKTFRANSADQPCGSYHLSDVVIRPAQRYAAHLPGRVRQCINGIHLCPRLEDLPDWWAGPYLAYVAAQGGCDFTLTETKVAARAVEVVWVADARPALWNVFETVAVPRIIPALDDEYHADQRVRANGSCVRGWKSEAAYQEVRAYITEHLPALVRQGRVLYQQGARTTDDQLWQFVRDRQDWPQGYSRIATFLSDFFQAPSFWDIVMLLRERVLLPMSAARPYLVALAPSGFVEHPVYTVTDLWNLRQFQRIVLALQRNRPAS